jgi:hypothetical protein
MTTLITTTMVMVASVEHKWIEKAGSQDWIGV